MLGTKGKLDEQYKTKNTTCYLFTLFAHARGGAYIYIPSINY
jgi:hypothetical protein